MPLVTEILKRLQSLASWGLGHTLYRVHGHSMHPTLQHGDLVLVRTQSKREPLPGDIVVARDPGYDRILVKRVLSRGDMTVYLGSDDPNTGRDSRHFGSVPIATLLGTVIRTLPRGPERPRPPAR